MIENRLLEELVWIRKCGTLSAAAEELRISQPALSRSMKKLEQDTGLTLFIHRRNSLALNETGKRMAQEAEQLLLAQEEALARVRAFDMANTEIRVGTCAPGPEYVLNEFCRNNGTLRFTYREEADENVLLAKLKHNDLDILFLRYDPHDPEISCSRFMKETLAVSVLPAHPAACYPQGIHFRDMNGQTFLQMRSVGIWQDIVERNLPESQIIKQDRREDMQTLVNNSALPTFVTNITSPQVMQSYLNRIRVPFLDPEATVIFYCVCRREDRRKYDPVFSLAVKETLK